MDCAQILIVEDEAVVAMDIQSRLEELGYTVIGSIRSGDAAIQTACALRPDLILMDINLQGEMDGISAAAHIQEQNLTPIVYITAHGDEDTLRRAMITEPLGFIVKPIDHQKLRITIEVALNKHQMVEAREDAQREHAKEAVRERTVELALRHRELAALNSSFQKDLKIRGKEERDYREFRGHVKDIVNRIQGLLDELNHRLQDGSAEIGPLLNQGHGQDARFLFEDPPYQEPDGQCMAVNLAELSQNDRK